MKKKTFSQIVLKVLMAIVLLLCGISNTYSDIVGINFTALSNPSNLNFVVPGGDPLPFSLKIENATTTSYNNAVLKVTIPEDWSFDHFLYNSINYAASDISGNVYSFEFTLPASVMAGVDGNAPYIEVYLKPGCSASYSNRRMVTYELYSSDGIRLATSENTSAERWIGNFSSPQLSINISSGSAIGHNIDGYQEWIVNQKTYASYILGGNLWINDTIETNSMKYSKLQLKTGVNTWTDIWIAGQNDMPGFPNVAITGSTGNLTYRKIVITNEILQAIGNNNNRLEESEELVIRSVVQLSNCDITTSNIKYNAQSECGLNKNMSAAFNVKYPFNVNLSIDVVSWPTTTNSKGILHYTVVNTSGSLAIANLAFLFATTGVKISSFTPTDGNWSPLSGVTTFTQSDGLFSGGTVPGIYENNSLLANATFHATVEFEATQLDANACIGGLLSTFGTGKVVYKSPCSTSGDPVYLTLAEKYFDSPGIGYTTPSVSIPSSNVSYNTVTTLTVRTTTDNSKPSLMFGGVQHDFCIQFPTNLLYTNSGNITDASRNTIDVDRISWDETSRMLIISDIDPNNISDLIFHIEVQVNEAETSTGIKSAVLKTKHLIHWGDGIAYEYACNTVSPISLNIKEPVPACGVIFIKSTGIGRSTFGFKSETDLTRYSSVEEAKVAGVNLHAAGPYDYVNIDMEINAVGSNVITMNDGTITAEVMYRMPYVSSWNNNSTNLLGVRSDTDAPGAILHFNDEEITVTKGDITFENGIYLYPENEPDFRRYYVRLNLTKYLGTKKLTSDDKITLSFLLQVAETSCPHYSSEMVNPQVSVSISGGSKSGASCFDYMDIMSFFDYKLSYSNYGYLNNSYAFKVNATDNIGLVMRRDLHYNSNYTYSTSEVFPNEFRPAMSLQKLNASIPVAMRISNLYSYSYEIPDPNTPRKVISPSLYEIRHNAGGETELILNAENSSEVIYSGEYYSRYDEGFRILAQYELGCPLTTNNITIKSAEFTHYPTSEYPQAKKEENASSYFLSYSIRTDRASDNSYNLYSSDPYFNSEVKKYNTGGTRKIWGFVQASGTNAWVDSNNKKIPFTWFGYKVTKGNIKNLIFQKRTDAASNINNDDIGGTWETMNVAWEQGDDGYIWAKLGEFDFNDTPYGNNSFYYRLCFDAGNDCKSEEIEISRLFGVSRFGYPTGGPTGILWGKDENGATISYQTASCNTTISTIKLLADDNYKYNTYLTETLNSSGESTNTYKFCDPLMYEMRFENPGNTTYTNLKVRVELPRQVIISDVLSDVMKFNSSNKSMFQLIRLPAIGTITVNGSSVNVTSSNQYDYRYVKSVMNYPYEWNYPADNPSYKVGIEVEGEKRYLVYYTRETLSPVGSVSSSYTGWTTEDNASVSSARYANDKYILRFGVNPACGFTDGKALSVTAMATNTCGDIVSFTPHTTPAIEIQEFTTAKPQITITDINGETVSSSIVSYTVKMKKDDNPNDPNDNLITLTGHYSFIANPGNVNQVEAMIEIPNHLELVTDESYLQRLGSSYSKTFIQSGNQLIAEFDPDNLIGEYDFKIVLKPDISKLNCEEKNIIVMARDGASVMCAGQSTACTVYRQISAININFTIEKINAQLKDVVFEEYFDMESNSQKIKATGVIVNLDPDDNGEENTIESIIVGLYSDSGTLTNNEETVTDIPGGSEKAFTIIATATAVQMCSKLRVEIPQTDTKNIYLCSSVESFSETVPYKLQQLNYEICQGTTLSVGDPAIEGYTYTWESSDANVLISGNSSPVNFTYKNAAEGSLAGGNQTQKVKLTIVRNGDNTCKAESYVNIYVVPKNSTWLGSDENWNNVYNWSNGIPDKCTDVLIPDLKNYYPILQSTTADYIQPACAKITFEHGGEVSKTYLLDYDEAEVHLTLAKNQWYTLAAPLRDMYSGDLYEKNSDPMFTSRPKVYIQQYQTVNPQNAGLSSIAALAGNWSKPFNTADVRLKLGSGFISGVALTDGNGYFAFPSKHISGDGIDADYTYGNGTAYKSGDYIKQYAYFSSDGVTRNGSWTTWGNIVRDHAARFIYEEDGAASKVTTPTTGRGKPYSAYITYSPTFNLPITGTISEYGENYQDIIVGNPLMSHLDFVTLQAANSSKIQNKYQLWNGKSFDAYISAMFGTNYIRHIAPMQSFVVQKVNKNDQISSLSIDASTMSTTLPKVKLRSSTSTPLMGLDVYRDGERHSTVTLIYDPNASSSFHDSKDYYTLFNTQELEPAVGYALIDGKAASVYTSPFGQPVELGIRTSKTGLLSFHMNGLDQMDSDKEMMLEDRSLTNFFHSLSNEPVYEFQNTTGNVEGRFFLHLIAKSNTGLDDLNNSTLRIYGYNSSVKITSSAFDPIIGVEITDMQGRILVRENNLAAEAVSYPVQTGQVVIVKAYTDRLYRTEKTLVK